MLLQGSTRGVTVGVKVLLSRFKTSHGLVLVSAHSNLLIAIPQCGLGWYFLVRWVGSFGGIFKIMGFVLVATFFCQRLESAYHW